MSQPVQKVQFWGPKEYSAVASIAVIVIGGVAWLQSIASQVQQISTAVQPIIQMTSDHERRLTVVEDRSEEWKQVGPRLSALEQQMARQAAILEQLLVRIDDFKGQS